MHTSFLHISLFIFFLGLITFSSCTENECCSMPDATSMEGTWKLSKLCIGTGATTCLEEDMWDADIDETITFSDGEFIINREGVICSGNFLITLSKTLPQHVELNATTGNCSFEETTYWLGRISATEMLFSPMCFEGCPHLYIRQ